ncbi:MAG: GNAT family N-acetyltransferase [Pyrinomonadaceae bacterium]
MLRPKKAQELEVRLAGPGDEETVARLLCEAFEPFREQYTAGGFSDTTAPPDVIRERFSTAVVWLAVEGGEAAGTVSALPESDRIYIRSMAVTPGAQGRGIGRKLLETLETYAREHGFTKLYLYTTFVLPVARLLYERNGFYVTRETPPEEWFDMPGLEMEKILD